MLRLNINDYYDFNMDKYHDVIRHNYDAPNMYINGYHKFLAYVSTKLSGRLFLDIGTFKGLSLLALGLNQNNYVNSYDITKQELYFDYTQFSNMSVQIINSLDDISDKTILNSSLIFFDIDHSGEHEEKFIKRLNNIEYRGLVFMDDIYLNKNMNTIWNNIKNPKYDLTQFVTDQGLGLITFGDNIWKELG